MATSCNILCGICEAQDITKYADHWCHECDEGLCSDCQIHHNISKASRSHGVISIENYHQLPSSISEICNHCEYHDMNYSLFCQFHDKPCCPNCISTNHKDCVGLLSIREIINSSKTSTLIDNIEQNLTNIKNNIDKITKNRQQNLSEILQQRQMFQNQIKQMRVKINSHLDTLEQNILQELDDTEDKIKSKFDKLLQQLSRNSKSVEGLQSDIIAVKEYASDLQAILGSKIIEEEVQKEEEYLMALLSDDGYRQQLNLRYTINTKIKDILSTITTFGSVYIETSPPTVDTRTIKAEQAQIMSVIQHPSVKSINDIKLTLHTTFNIPKGKGSIAITGCIVCPNGKMIVVDNSYNRRLVTLNEDGTLDKEISCSYYPFDVTCLDDTTVAVSTTNGIEIVNIDSAETERFIKTSKPCRGITYHNGVLLWCEYERGIQMMQLSDDRVTTLVKQLTLSCSYITTCGDKIYQTNRDTNTVTCYTIKGNKLWKYKDVSVLNDPRGVTVDNNSNVYVTSCSFHKVVVIEPGGRQGRQLISSDDGLADPNGIYFNKSKNSLCVANLGKAFLYNMC